MYKKNRKMIFSIFIILLGLFVTNCAYQNNLNDLDKTLTDNILENEIPINNISINNEEISKNANEVIKINLLGKHTISINKNRINDDVFGTGQLDNRWELNEIDEILNSIKGVWQIDQYIGFVDSSIYFPDLFDPNDNLEKNVKNQLYEDYEEKKKNAEKNIPQFYFSIKEYDNKETVNNYIYVNNNYRSPISIILSMDRLSENYSIFVDQTTISSDFFAEYPIIYIKFHIAYKTDDKGVEYTPATLVLSSDNKFYILIDGAFYSLQNI